MKKLILFLISCCMAVAALAGTANSIGLIVPPSFEERYMAVYSPSKYYFYIPDEDKAEVTLFDPYYYGEMKAVMWESESGLFDYNMRYIIPSEVESNGKKYTVTSIARGTVNSTAQCTGILLPDSLIALEEVSIVNAQELSAIEFGSKLRHIGVQTIYNLPKLKQLIFPENLVSISLYSCSKLGVRRIQFNNKLTSIGQYSFCELSNLEDVELPPNIWSLICSFNECSKLKTVTIHNVMGRFENCFNGCPALETVIIDPESRFDFYCLRNSFNMIDKSKCTFYVSKNAMGVEEAQSWGYKVVVDNYPGSNSQVKSIPTEETSVRRYDLNGNAVNPDADAKRGEILIECIGNEVHKVIQ